MQMHAETYKTINTSGHSSLEKSTSHFIRKGSKGLRKVLSVRGELETEQNWNVLTPPNSSGYSSISFPFSWAAQAGAWGPSLYWGMVFIPASSLRLIWTSCRRGYIIIWRPPTSCKRHICTQFNPSTVKFVPRYLWPDAPVIYTGAFLLLTAWPGSICYIYSNIHEKIWIKQIFLLDMFSQFN